MGLFEDMKKRIRNFEFSNGIEVIDYSLHETPEDLIRTIDDLEFQVQVLMNDLIDMQLESEEEKNEK